MTVSRRLTVPLVFYLAGALGVPILNGATAQAGFAEHAVPVALAALLLVASFAGVSATARRWRSRTPGPMLRTRMMDLDETARRVGLCADCRHARRIVSAKKSEFWLCERSQRDPAFRKYPPLPVRRCEGHEPKR